jgi:hypothetical protein
VFGKMGGDSPAIEGGTRGGGDQGGNGGGGKVYLADSGALSLVNLLSAGPGRFNYFGQAGTPTQDTVVVQPPDPARGTTPEEVQDLTEMTGTVGVSVGQWGDDPREPMFGPTQIVTEFFDTLSDSTSYDGALILWNAPRYPYQAGNASMRTMRILIDTTKAGPGGLPDLSVEDATGNFTNDPDIGFTQEVPAVSAAGPAAAFQMQEVLPAGAASQGKRFVRVRLIFDPTLISNDPNVLFAGGAAPVPGGVYPGFALPGTAPIPIADDPATPDLENTRGNLDTAPAGVPAFAEVRVTFTP